MANKKTKHANILERKRFKESSKHVFIVPINVWGWLAIIGFLFLLFSIAFINFGYEETTLKGVLGFMRNVILLFALTGWLFDKKSYRKS